MKLNKQWLKKQNACSEGFDWFAAQKETDVIKIIKKLMKENHFDWANWLIVRKMKYKQYVSYAVFAAEQVIDIFENKYPEDKRPRQAIEAAKACIENPSNKNKTAANAAAYAAYAAANAAYAAYAAYAAANAAAAAAAYAAANANAAAKTKLQKKIINHGIKLLKEGIDG